MNRSLACMWFALVSLVALPMLAQADDAAGIAFFEKKIRPVLIEHCYECHSAQSKAVKGGLWLDTQNAMRQGGDSGPAIVPNNVDESLLIQALKYDGINMPPRRKLPASIVADFEQWINMGAPDPRQGKAPSKGQINIEAGRQFWAYQLPKAHEPPRVKDQAWPKNDVDRFVLAKLDAQGLKPVGDASRRDMIRRLSYDLIGLPPTPEEIAAFERDTDPRAYEKLVDRLLASPRFGERWGRHWLDVARYAESLTLRGFVLKDAWRYRDYVIESFNQDLPFDQFVREQVAGDLLGGETLEQRRRQLIATSFLAIGNHNLEEQDKQQLAMDIVDEQLDVIGKGLLAQTVTCARCHDHKFDPIPTRDYYALAGILKSTKTVEHSNVSKWLEMPLPVESGEEQVLKAHEQKLASMQGQIKSMKDAIAAAAKKTSAVASTTGSAPPVSELMGIVIDDSQARKVGNWTQSKYSKSFIGAGYLHDENKDKGAKTVTFIPELPKDGKYEVRLAYVPGTNRAERVPVTVFSADGEIELTINQRERPTIDGHFVSLGQFRFERAGQSYVIVSNEGTSGHVIADAVQFIPVEQLSAAKTVAAKEPAKKDESKPSPANEDLTKLEAELKQLTAKGPKRPTVVGVTEEKKIADTYVHIRGSVHNVGDTVPRGFMQVASYSSAPTFTEQQSGRRELAEWLASEQNPLTARVMANRVWSWLFGNGIVRTTDNFGSTGETPSHNELLDHLTVQFVAEGWSVKKLIRTLVLSHTYQMSCVDDARSRAVDPDNRLWWHMPRRRLDGESLRDTLLAVAGNLDLSLGGPTFEAYGSEKKSALAADYNYTHTDTRRSVYSPAFRNSPVELVEVFDAADPSTVTGHRNVSTVATQALYMMNHPFVLKQAELMAERLRAEKLMNDRARIERLYQLALGRTPTSTELSLAEAYIAKAGSETDEGWLKPWAQLVQTVFCSIDFRYVD